MTPPRWRPSEVLLLIDLALARRHNTKEIARIVGRSEGAIQAKAKRLNLTLHPSRWHRPKRDPDTSTWSEADRIAVWADVPQELAEIVVGTCHELGLPVSAVRSNSRKRPLVACRQVITCRAKAVRYSYALIGRAINRDHSSVIHLVRSNSSPQFTGAKFADRIPSDAYTARWNTARTSAAG